MIELHPGQSQVYRDLFIDRNYRFATVCAARGWGKTFFAAACAVTACYELLELDPSVRNKNVFIVAPTHEQVTDIYYPILTYEFGLEDICVSSSKDRGRFLLPNDVTLKLVSYEAVERLRGKGAYFIIGDEVSSWKKGITAKKAWEAIMQPCVVTRWSPQNAKRVGAKSPGRALNISTPEGYNFFHEMYNYRETDSRWGSYHFDYTTSPYLDPEEVEMLQHTIDPLEFAREYKASFRESGASVFYNFDRSIHVTVDIPDFEPYEDIHVSIDFNVGIMAASVFAVRGGQMHFLHELQGMPDTESLAKALALHYPHHEIYAYPDPTGKSRKSSAPVGRTDFSILEAYGIHIRALSASPTQKDSANSVNRMLMTATGDVNMFFHPRCKRTIQSMERTKWVDNNPNSLTIDKSENIEHHSDGVRYATDFLFPIGAIRRAAARGFGF